MRSIYELLPNEIKDLGYTEDIIYSIYSQLYIKKQMETKIELVVDVPRQVKTLDGVIMAMPGMYVVTGTKNEQNVITKETLELSYTPVFNKVNIYIKKRYPVIIELKNEKYVVPNPNAKGGYLMGKPGSILVQSMIDARDTYPIDVELFQETYIPYIDYLREKEGIYEEKFVEEVLEEELTDNVFQKVFKWFKNIWNIIKSKFNKSEE